MSYTLYYSLGAITIAANTINSQTSIYLPGEDYVPYGQPVDQSLLSLLQNFANVTPPPRPIPGQLWFDTNDNIMKVTTNGGSAAVWSRIDGNGLPGGTNTSVQFNNAGYLGGDSNFTYNSTTGTVGVIGNVTVSDTMTLGGNATIAGNLQVNGTTTFINVSTLSVQDPIISLGRGANNTSLSTNDGKDRGTQMWYYSGSEKSAFMGYDNGPGKMVIATDVTITAEFVTVNNYGNVLMGNIEATSLSTTGSISAGGVISGDGSGLSSINGANISGVTPLATYATSSGTAGTVTTAAQPNITSVGTLTSLNVAGAVNAGSLAGGAATGVGASGTWGINITGSSATAGTVTTAAQPNITSVGTLSSLNVSGPLTTTQLTTGSTGTGGSMTGQWTLTPGSTLNATYADLAERYVSDAQYEPGTVVEFGGEYEVTLAEAFTSRVAGVVSTNAAYIMNGDCSGEHVITLALQGRVPCRVVGPVRKGDMMISAGNGEAMASGTPAMGTVIGKAIENFDGESGVIEVVVGRI